MKELRVPVFLFLILIMSGKYEMYWVSVLIVVVLMIYFVFSLCQAGYYIYMTRQHEKKADELRKRILKNLGIYYEKIPPY